MTAEFQVVTDVNEIATLNERLARQLAKTFKHQEVREITYPAGHHTGDVFFERKRGTGVRAWSPGKGKGKLLNFMLVGDPGIAKWMQIDVQLNFPAKKYNRKMAGAFVRDSSGAAFVAHRGKLTKGKAGLPKEQVFREFASRVVEAEDDGRLSRVILVGGLEDKDLADRLWSFAEEAREVATRLGAELHGAPTATDPAKSKPQAAKRGSGGSQTTLQQLMKLRSYFDEYSGNGSFKGHGGGTRTVEHGDIVRALEAHLASRGETQKAQAIDLAVVTAEKVDLFEVKTSARTTDVYTAVGQLLIHGGSISDLLKKPVQRFVVLPEAPSSEHAKQMRRKAGLSIITFEKRNGTYVFAGI